MNIIQQYARSVNSKSLQDDSTHHHTDALAAVALSSKFGSILYRVKFAADQHSLVPLLEIWRNIVKKRAERDGFAHLAEEVADISLWAWMDDICPACHGRGHPVITGTPTLEAMPCPACNGSGRKPLQCDSEIKEWVRDCMARLEEMASDAARKARFKLDK